LASLPKQVIFDTVDVSNESDQPFDLLQEVLLGQFGKSKWKSYFELLRLPMEMQGHKPSILMGKLKQHLPHGVSPDNDVFLSMFLIRLPPSMREAVGAGNHKTALTIVRAADSMWVIFYRCFFPNCARVLCPLTDLLRGRPKTLEWTAAVQESFQNAKCLLVTTVPFQHPAPKA
jgi:hypothetical protein